MLFLLSSYLFFFCCSGVSLNLLWLWIPESFASIASKCWDYRCASPYLASFLLSLWVWLFLTFCVNRLIQELLTFCYYGNVLKVHPYGYVYVLHFFLLLNNTPFYMFSFLEIRASGWGHCVASPRQLQSVPNVQWCKGDLAVCLTDSSFTEGS